MGVESVDGREAIAAVIPETQDKIKDLPFDDSVELRGYVRNVNIVGIRVRVGIVVDGAEELESEGEVW